MSKSALVTILLLITQTLSSAEILNVPLEYTTIQEAINNATEGDTVVVGPGTYQENLHFQGRNITLTSTNPDDPDIVASTIINGDAQSSVITFDSGETSETVLTGFTISGGYGTFIAVDEVGRDTITGGGIYCINASPTIKKNVITNNSNDSATRDAGAEGWGGGIGCLNSNAIITHNIIKNNYSFLGGGILTAMGNAVVTNNLIYDNSAVAGGGALIVAGSLINNTIVNNYSSDSGGNVYLVSYQEFGYCTVLSNIISYPRGTGSIFRESSLPQDRFEFNNIWDGSENIYAPVTKKKDIRGNIYMPTMMVNSEGNDFRLLMDSPCINAGDPNYSAQSGDKDMYDNARIVYGRVDIGAAEFSGNLRPVADAGDDQSTDELPGFVNLDASRSYDPDGNENLSYQWTQTAGPSVDIENADSQTAKFIPADYGVYSFDLSVSDGTFDSFTDNVTIILGTNHIPVAKTGLPVYGSDEAVTIDGTGSYDPDNSGELLYSWEQISGPTLVITDSNTATPQISGFIRIDELQICQFQLVVYDGQYESLPEIAEVRIFPDFGRAVSIHVENGTFDPNRPTMIYFGGGDCINGSGTWVDNEWNKYANILSMSYQPDNMDSGPTYYIYGDAIVKFLSETAPNYNGLIQTLGHSTGGQPAMDVALRMNLTYKDPRYNVNRVTLLDGRCRDYSANVLNLIDSAVDGEQCWMDTYEGTGPFFYPGILNVQVALNNHGYPPSWYKMSLVNPNMMDFNGGLVGGAYWSVIGPGKNLQLAKTPLEEIYRFHWEGTQSGEMQFFDEANFPARLPEPVMLIGPVNIGQSDGGVITCTESQNAVGYQLLIGNDPHRVTDYTVISDTPLPPDEAIDSLPFEDCWWTVKAYDAYGSTIHADPKPVNMFNLSLPVTNMNTGMKYGYIQEAIDEADTGDELVLAEGIYNENISIQSKNVILRSTNPDDPGVVEATVIKGIGEGSVVTCMGSRVNSDCLISGLTITGSVTGVNCITSAPAITNCLIKDNKGSGIKLWDQSSLTISNCLVVDNKIGIELYQIPARVPNSATIVNCTISGNRQQGIWGGKPTIINSIVYFNETQIEYGNLANITYSDVQDSWPGPGNIDVDPLFAGSSNGDYHLKSQAGRWDPASQTWVQDDVTSPCIDTGDPGSNVGMEPEPNGSVINMGAYGGTIQASKSP